MLDYKGGGTTYLYAYFGLRIFL